MSAPVRGLLGAAAGIAVVTALARVAGFGRTAAFSRGVGLDCVGSTYQVANAVPNVVFEVVAGGALAAAVVPVLATTVASGDREGASRAASALLTWTVLVLAPCALLALVAAPLLVGALLGPDPACGPAAVEVGTSMLRVFAPQVVLYGVVLVLAGVLQAHRRFLGPAVAPLLSSVVVASAYLLYATRGREELPALSTTQELVLSVGTTLGVAAMVLALLVALRGTGVRLRPTLAFAPGVAARVLGLAGAGVAGLAAQQVALVVALRLASADRQGPGVFVVATALFLLPWAVLALPVATSAFPLLAAAAGDPVAYAATARRALSAVLVVALGGAAVLHAVAGPAAALLTDDAAGALASAVRAFAPGVVAYGLLALLGRALLATGDTRTVAAATVCGWLAVAVADVVLVSVTDLPRATALGLGNAIGLTLAAVLLLAGLRRTAPDALDGAARTALVGTAGAVAAAGLVAALPAIRGPVLEGLAYAALATAVYALVVRLGDPAAVRGLRHG